MLIILLVGNASYHRALGTDPHPYSEYPPDLVMPPWEKYIASYTNTCIVGHGKTTGVLLNLDLCKLYQCKHSIDLNYIR